MVVPLLCGPGVVYYRPSSLRVAIYLCICVKVNKKNIYTMFISFEGKFALLRIAVHYFWIRAWHSRFLKLITEAKKKKKILEVPCRFTWKSRIVNTILAFITHFKTHPQCLLILLLYLISCNIFFKKIKIREILRHLSYYSFSITSFNYFPLETTWSSKK